jgi:hypothetical protein
MMRNELSKIRKTEKSAVKVVIGFETIFKTHFILLNNYHKISGFFGEEKLIFGI